MRLDFDDLVQIGYEAAFKAIKKYDPTKATFTSFLCMRVYQAFGNVIKAANYQKRDSLDVSYQDLVSNEKSHTQTETFEDFLVDRKKNVENTVIEKLMIEEGLSYCKPVQKETFILYFMGYTAMEISEIMGAPKGTVNRRLQEALTKIAGKPVNLRNIGYEFKRKGA
jgi:RNA polymerase sigma factor (sigma-70 family)